LPKVSVLLPVHNGARHLRAAIASVLAQTHRDFELLIVDDHSTDDTPAIARGFDDARIRMVAGPHQRGLVHALNTGLQAASGEYVARLDHDDLAHATRLAMQVSLLDARPEVALVGSLARLIDEDDRAIGTVRRPLSAAAIRWYSLVQNPLIHSSAMFRRDVVLALGGYDASLPLAEDYELWGRVLQSHVVENLDACLIDYRRSSSSIMTALESDDDSPRQQQLSAIMARLIKRRIESELGAGECSDADAALLATFTLGIDRRRWRDFLVLLTSLRTRFEARWSGAAADEEYWRTIADQYDAVAFRMRPPSRSAAAGVYQHAWSRAPRAAAYLSWPRAGALLLFGPHGRQLLASRMARLASR
jgi:glycosyltransferase involved in cell wall biosynthesis